MDDSVHRPDTKYPLLNYYGYYDLLQKDLLK